MKKVPPNIQIMLESDSVTDPKIDTISHSMSFIKTTNVPTVCSLMYKKEKGKQREDIRDEGSQFSGLQ